MAPIERFPPCPLSYAELERFRIRLMDNQRAGLLGGELTLRKGQSLEFREFAQYTPGEDVRHIDWRATERRYDEDSGSYLVRRYQAEEQFSLAISIDTRSTLFLPESASKQQTVYPKITLSIWLAEALAWIALRSGHSVILHRLFGAGKQDRTKLTSAGKNATTWDQIRSGLSQIDAFSQAPDMTLNSKPLEQNRSSAVAWLILSDYYFGQVINAEGPDSDDEEIAATQLSRQIASARNSFCWVALVNLDSWLYERSIIAKELSNMRAWRIDGPGAPNPTEMSRIENDQLDEIAERIRLSREQLLNHQFRMNPNDISHWSYPDDEPIDLGAFIRKRFLVDSLLGRLVTPRI